MSNEVTTPPKTTIARFLSDDKNQAYLNTVIGNRKEKFVTNLVSIVNQNKTLQECTNNSLLSGAIVATTLNLSLNKSFGYAYLVPYDNKKANPPCKEAQFQIGYKGYIQLAMRTGEYKRLNALPIYENQFISWNAMEEELKLNNVTGDGNIIGYVAYFRLINGFEKTMFWAYDQMLKHADTYSQAFSAKSYELLLNNKIPSGEMWKYSSFWYKSFDDMALKTMLRQLLGKYGILSEEMQKAYEFDQSVVIDDKPQYIDRKNEDEVIPQIDVFSEPVNSEIVEPSTVNINEV